MVSAARLAANRRSLASAIGAGIISPGAGGGVPAGFLRILSDLSLAFVDDDGTTLIMEA